MTVQARLRLIIGRLSNPIRALRHGFYLGLMVEGLELTISLIQIIFASNNNETCMLLITDRSDITVEGILKDEMVAGELMPYK